MSAVCAGAVGEVCLIYKVVWVDGLCQLESTRIPGFEVSCRVYVSVGRFKFNYLTILVRAKDLKVSPMTAQESLCKEQVFMQ